MTSPDRLPAAEDKRAAVRDMFDRISDRYDLVNRIMTFGLDQRWRRRLVGELALPPASRILDIACGTGDLCDIIRERGHQAFGLDLSFGMLQHAHTEAPLTQADGLALPLRASALDGITCGFALRNVTDLTALFAECARVLRPGGRVGFIEVSEPRSRILRAGHRVYFHHLVPRIGAMLSDREAYRYLPASTAYLPDARELDLLLESAGFANIDRHHVGAGAAQLILATRR